MSNDTDETIREFAINKITAIRNNQNSSDNLRTFEIPVLNLFAEDYTKLFDWNKCSLTEPPITQNVSMEELRAQKNVQNFSVIHATRNQVFK